MTTDLIVYEQRTILFYGDDLIAVQTDQGVYVPVKPICDRLRIDWSAQRKRILRDTTLRSGMAMITIPSAGGTQIMLCLPDDMLHGWLFGVDDQRIAPEHRDSLIRYKKDCYRILREAFTGTPATPSTLATWQASVDARLSALERTPTAARRHLRALGWRLEREDILRVLTDYGSPLRLVTIAEILDRPLTNVAHLVIRMARQHQLARVGYGVYGLLDND